MEAGMFVHAVYFWLRHDLNPQDRKRFAAGLESLRTIDGVEHGWIGVPASTDRAIIERGYSNALVLVFANERSQDAYQSHPVHDKFREECGGFWTAVRIYDSITEETPE